MGYKSLPRFLTLIFISCLITTALSGPQSVDLGVVSSETTSVAASLNMLNATNIPVRYSIMSTSCGCTSATFSADRLVNPGENARIDVLIDTTAKTGAFKEEVNVEDSAGNTFSYNITGVVVRETIIRPETFQLGRIAYQQQQTKYLSVVSAKPIPISEIELSCPEWDGVTSHVKFLKEFTDGDIAQQAEVSISFPWVDLDTDLSTALQIKIRYENNEHNEFTIPVTATFGSPVEVDPQYVFVAATVPNRVSVVISKPGITIDTVEVVPREAATEVKTHLVKNGIYNISFIPGDLAAGEKGKLAISLKDGNRFINKTVHLVF